MKKLSTTFIVIVVLVIIALWGFGACRGLVKQYRKRMGECRNAVSAAR
jgi:Sec-independent protein translocase protein TatA